LVQIWRYVKREVSREAADRVESVIRSKCVYLASFPGAGHWRHDLTSADVRFFSVYSYLIVYRPETRPLQVVTILHGSRNVPGILSEAL
jgi:antitoxin ParD1/3/4/toxin ParE1/3/4